MILNHRPSILQRPKKIEPSKSSEENLDREHQREQDRWKIKAAKLAEAEERLRRGNYAFPEDKERCKEEIREVVHASQQAKQEAAKLSTAAKELWAKPVPKGDLYDPERPWTAPAQDLDESDAAIARRRNVWRAAEENKRAVLEHAIANREKSATDQESVRQAALKEESFWNYGASSDKWIPPARRVKPASRHALKQACRGAPYAAPDPSMPRVQLSPHDAHVQHEGGSAIGSKPPAAKQYPWSWDVEPQQAKRGR